MKVQKKSFTFFNHLFVFIFFVFTLSSCSREDLENVPDLSDHAQEADNFIQSTINRIAESWESVSMEFRLAWQHLGDQPVYLQRELEAKAEIAAENLIENTVDSLEKQAEQAKEQIYDAAKDVIDEQRKSVDRQLEYMQDQWKDAQDDISEKSEDFTEHITEKIKPEK